MLIILGKTEDVQFKYAGGSVFAVYCAATTPNDGYTRLSEIMMKVHTANLQNL